MTGITTKDLKGKHGKTLDVITVREYMNLARASFRNSKGEIVSISVPTGIIPSKKEREKEQRSAFICWYMCWLHIDWRRLPPFTEMILFMHEGIWHVDITDNHDRKVKNQNPNMKIPLYHVLVDQIQVAGFVQSAEGD